MHDDDEVVLHELGRRVRQLRMAKDWTQHRLAAETRIHQNYLGGIERGERNPTITNVARIASALGVSLADLFMPDSRDP